MARGTLRVPPARLRGRALAQPAPEGRRVRRLPVHRPALPALRQDGRPAQRGRGRHLRRARLPDHAPQRAAAAARVPLRARPHQRGAARATVLQGRRLPALPDRRRPRRLLVPDAAQDGQQARAHRGGDLRRQLRRGRARHLQRQAGDHQLPQDRPPAARGLSRPRAHEGALHRRGPRPALRRHPGRLGAGLGHARELQGGRRGARGDQRVGPRAPDQRDLPRPDGVLGDHPAADADRIDLGHERPRAGRAEHPRVLDHHRDDGDRARRTRGVLPAARMALDLQRMADVAALERPAEAKRMLVIVNPYATTMSDRLKHLVVYALQGRYDVHAVDTQRRGHATELCREAARQGYDVVVAFGGDGTVNEAANGIAGTSTPLTCLPGGATNVYCRMLAIPNDVVDATEHLLALADDWRPRRVDLGSVNGRLFVFSAGAGLDASVVERVDAHPRLKARYGPMFYATSAVGTFLRRYVVNPPRVVVEVEGHEPVTGVSAFVQNADPYTYFRARPIDLVDGVELDSGDLGGVVLRRASPVDIPTVLWRALSQRAKMEKHRQVTAFPHVDRIVVRSSDERPVPVQVDGDFVGLHEEAVFTVRPGAM